jgi:acyl dehydratase
VSFQHRAMIVPGDTLTVWAKVTNKYEKDGLGYVEMDCGIRLHYGAESCPGKATIVLPIKGGKAIPYPFVPPAK